MSSFDLLVRRLFFLILASSRPTRLGCVPLPLLQGWSCSLLPLPGPSTDLPTSSNSSTGMMLLIAILTFFLWLISFCNWSTSRWEVTRKGACWTYENSPWMHQTAWTDIALGHVPIFLVQYPSLCTSNWLTRSRTWSAQFCWCYLLFWLSPSPTTFSVGAHHHP